MNTLLDSIHIAVADGAPAEDRRRGAEACRALADALTDPDASVAVTDAEVTVPTALPVEEPRAPVAVRSESPLAPAPTPLSLGLSPNPFAGMTADQVLDLAITRLRSAIGEAAPPASAGDPFRLTLVPIPRLP